MGNKPPDMIFVHIWGHSLFFAPVDGCFLFFEIVIEIMLMLAIYTKTCKNNIYYGVIVYRVL